MFNDSLRRTKSHDSNFNENTFTQHNAHVIAIEMMINTIEHNNN
jgi:hypothetical protein